LDVGCGLGTWLLVAKQLGIDDLTGIDGYHLDKSKLVIGDEKVILMDLETPFDLQKKFDLIICLEVAEHISPQSAEQFVDVLVRHSDTIMFSAAVPFQGGQNHLNEQWPDWWQEKFEKRGFLTYDFLRIELWDRADVFYWYKQNLVFYSRNVLPKIQPQQGRVRRLIHPDLFLNKATQLKNLQEGRTGIKTSFRVFLNALYRKVKR